MNNLLKQKSWRGRALAIALVLSMAVVCLVAPASAFAADTTGYVTAAATRAAGPAPEILGISGVEESGQFVDSANWVNWAQPKFEYLTTGISTSDNPYFVNMVANPQITPFAVYNSDGRTGGGNGPNASLAAYNSSDATDIAIWNLLPDIIIGNGGSTNYTTSAGLAGAANGNPSYSPASITYTFNDNTGLINTMYDIATAGDAVVAGSTKSLRFGSATDIAVSYEAYIRGTQGYILSVLEEGNPDQQRQTVAVVTGVSGSGSSALYSLALSGVSSGTASTNRFLETVEVVADNYANTIGGTAPTATAAQLAANVDLVIVGGQGLSPSQNAITDALSQSTVIPQTQIFYAYDGDNSYTGLISTSPIPAAQTAAMYGVIMNSVENAQNIGRLLGYLYPTILNQADYLAYYFEQFYHISDTDLISTLTNSLENCVPNNIYRASPYVTFGQNMTSPSTGDAYFHWSASNWASGGDDVYGKDTVVSQINTGIQWLLDPDNDVSEVLQLTEGHFTADDSDDE